MISGISRYDVTIDLMSFSIFIYSEKKKKKKKKSLGAIVVGTKCYVAKDHWDLFMTVQFVCHCKGQGLHVIFSNQIKGTICDLCSGDHEDTLSFIFFLEHYCCSRLK
jgi:hypothetical protein